jgi:lipopolysaccharide transport system permease protein
MPSISDIVEPPALVIEPPKGWVSIDWREIWQYRELLVTLTWRNITTRYVMTILGPMWAIIQPLVTMGVYNIFFGVLIGLRPDNNIPYPVFTFCALLPWQLFTRSLSIATNSLVVNQAMMKKIYFPRLINPIASVLTELVDFAIAFVVLLGLMLYFGIKPTIAVVALPLFTLLAVMAAFSIGLWLAPINAWYRDIGFAVVYLTQLLQYATPVVYSTNDMIPERWQALYRLNPMVGVIEGFRWALLGAAPPPLPLLLISTCFVLLLLVGGLYFFRRMEENIVDVL